jgi:putative membrane protein
MNRDPDVDRLAMERTLLAAERTLSAWIRTGLAGVGGGLAIARALVFRSEAHQAAAQVVGVFLVLWGAGIFVHAIVDYRRVHVRLTRDRAPKTPLFVLMLMTALLLIFAALVLWIIL